MPLSLWPSGVLLAPPLDIEPGSLANRVFIQSSPHEAPLNQKTSYIVLAPPPDHRKDPQPHARDLHQAWASATRRKTPGPGQGEPRGNGLSRKQEPGPGGWAGRPFPTAVRFLPLPASSVRHPGGAQSLGVSWWGRAASRCPHAASGAAPRPQLRALGWQGRG